MALKKVNQPELCKKLQFIFEHGTHHATGFTRRAIETVHALILQEESGQIVSPSV
jgi:hypothetical protein